MNDLNLTPITPSERIQALDLLRGLALFGVLWANLNDWYGTVEPVTAIDRGLAWTQSWMISSRFYTLLCLLFGIGFGIQLLRASEKGLDIKLNYLRRSLTLMGIGLVHALLIWNGDILTLYALVAFSLVMFRKSSSRRILTTAALLWVLSSYFVYHYWFVIGSNFYNPALHSDTVEWLMGHGSWLQIMSNRIANNVEWYGRFGFTFYFQILAYFLIGLWVVKSGYLHKVVNKPRKAKRLLLVGIVATIVGYLSYEYFSLLWPPPKVYPTGISDPAIWNPRSMVQGFFSWECMVWGTVIAYAAILLLILQNNLIARLLKPLAAAGRMALTTYLTQSVVCTLLFYGYGFGWYGKVGYTGNLVITLILFTCQMAASIWWLKRFRFGPVEWLWRRITYGSPLRMRISEIPPLNDI